ncbi:MAG: class I SAM-dependent methyltransferase [Pyrinomonadaceae bacterium]|nr:class I SAM-dependent methyltransferase [Pyrinomonadaceae bacterium]
MSEKKIFIGWSGKTGEDLAKAFKETFGDYPGIECFISSDLIRGKWFDKIIEEIEEADYCIGFVTPGTHRKIWFNFEAGYIHKKLGEYTLVLLGDKEKLLDSKDEIPLKHFHVISGEDKNQMIALMKDIVGTEARDKILDLAFGEWLEKYNKAKDQLAWEADIHDIAEPLFDEIKGLKYNSQLKDNHSLKLIITESIRELNDEIKDGKKLESFSAPAIQWTYNLVKLKNKFGDSLKLKAVSIIDQQDTFWLQDIGREILRLSRKETDERIFVFNTEADFGRHYEMIIDHSRLYKVRVITMQALTALVPNEAKDLGILYNGNSSLYALYDRMENQKKIKYSMSVKGVQKYETVFEKIKGASILIEAPLEVPEDSPLSFNNLKEELFGDFERFQSRFVEMSIYTSVWDYHQYSDKHPYYKDMTDEMMRVFKEHRGDETEKCRILEFGAGTGNFTERLVDVPNVDVLALEIDWAYYNIAKYRFSKYDHIKLEHADARKVNPEGKYKYIFSSFVDHHIKLKDKIKYLKNVEKNLEKGGLFIVGDSFLRKFDSNDKDDRAKALREYHTHIIETVNSRGGTPEFADMEINLMNAKLDENNRDVSDYKVSLEQYENYLHEAKLRIKGSPKKIGPLDFENVGGIYVFTIELP